MKSDVSFDINSQMKTIVLGCQGTLFLIALHQLYLGHSNEVIILFSTILLLVPVLLAVKHNKFDLASNIFCVLSSCIVTYYMWKFEGARDEASYVLPSIIAFSLLTGTRTVSILLITFLLSSTLLLGYLTEAGIRPQTISRNNLASSILISFLMSFSIFMFWVLLNYLKVTLTRIKHSLSTQNAILDNLGDSLIITDDQVMITQLSKSTNAMFGYFQDELLGNNIKLLIPEIMSHIESIEQPIQGELQHQKLIANRKNGVRFDIKCVLSKTKVDNKITFIFLISDITETITFQNQLKTAIEAADLANKAKSDFLANMSHEIRNPMNGVMGALQILSREKIPSSSAELVETAMLSSSSLLTILNDILDFSKVESGKLTLEKLPFSLTEVVNNIIAEVSTSLDATNNKLEFNIKSNYLEGWKGDPVRVKQIILNLVSNSIKFTNNDTVTIKLSSTMDKGIKIEVLDNGIGMSKEQVDNLFTRFEQADKSTTRKFGGTGLGMSITKSLVDLMDGNIHVESELKKGTLFTVVLPLTHYNIKQLDEVKNKALPVPELNGVNILLAEDNEINQKVFEKMMGQTGANIHIAKCGKQAVEMSERINPDIIFMDIQMPEMDGNEACERIKSKQPFIPIIALTANVMVEDVKRYAIVGFDAHIGKPIDINELYRACVPWVEKADRRRGISKI